MATVTATTSPVAMISYSWADSEPAELLHDELALRGFEVIHDRYTFETGNRIATAMSAGVERCDVFIPYLTRNSLYLDAPTGTARPAVTGELLPALRRRRANLRPGRPDRPIIIAIAHGLGDRATAGELLRRHTGDDLASLWSPWPAQDTAGLAQDEAASIADQALSAVLVDGIGERQALELSVATRGGNPPPRRFTIDATRLVGIERRTGTPADWERIAAALNSVANVLRRHDARDIRIELNCHLSAAYAVGRIFHQATRWNPRYETRHGQATAAAAVDEAVVRGDLDQYDERGDLIVDIDLLHHGVAALTDTMAAAMPRPGGRLSISTESTQDLTPTQIAASALRVSNQIRNSVAILRPERVHLTMAVPAAFAALLGHHTPAISSEVATYEFDGTRYVPAVVITPTAP
jgi:hypothetical protein